MTSDTCEERPLLLLYTLKPQDLCSTISATSRHAADKVFREFKLLTVNSTIYVLHQANVLATGGLIMGESSQSVHLINQFES